MRESKEYPRKIAILVLLGILVLPLAFIGRGFSEEIAPILIPLKNIADIVKERNLAGHSWSVRELAFSPDGKILASGSEDDTIILWDVETGNKIKTLTAKTKFSFAPEFAFSPDGKMLAAAMGPFMLIDLETGEGSAKSYGPFCSSVVFSPDGRFLATGSSTEERGFNPQKAVILCDVSSWSLKRKFKKDEFETTKEYEARVSQVEVPYAIPIALQKEQYNADRSGFEIDFKGNKLFIPVGKDRAKELVGRKAGEVKLVGKLKYYNPENLVLVEGCIVDSVAQERYAVYRIKE